MKPTHPQDSDRFLLELDAYLGECRASALALASVANGLQPMAATAATAATADGRARLLTELQPYDRFARFEPAVAELLQITPAEAAAALRRIDEPSAWLPQGPGIAFLPVPGAPEAGFFLSGFLRVEAGMEFPEHEHLGEEITLVLQGAFEESVSGQVFLPGEPAHMAAGTHHKFRVPEAGPHLLGLATVKVGLRLLPARV
jgi:hypothetical protein